MIMYLENQRNQPDLLLQSGKVLQRAWRFLKDAARHHWCNWDGWPIRQSVCGEWGSTRWTWKDSSRFEDDRQGHTKDSQRIFAVHRIEDSQLRVGNNQPTFQSLEDKVLQAKGTSLEWQKWTSWEAETCGSKPIKTIATSSLRNEIDIHEIYWLSQEW